MSGLEHLRLAAALALTVGGISAPVVGFAAVLIGLAFFVSYGFGQALTDCFQTDTDALSAPYRPLVRGLVEEELARMAAG